MNIRTRKLLGTIALFAVLAIYTLLALAVAAVLSVHEANKLVQLLFYVVAGLGWVIPAGILIRWMQRPD